MGPLGMKVDNIILLSFQESCCLDSKVPGVEMNRFPYAMFYGMEYDTLADILIEFLGVDVNLMALLQQGS